MAGLCQVKIKNCDLPRVGRQPPRVILNEAANSQAVDTFFSTNWSSHLTTAEALPMLQIQQGCGESQTATASHTCS
eukprot:13106330-Ditylum_brightwellii.AAC.1